MKEVLTKDEINQLLTAINAEDTKPEIFHPEADNRKIKVYDFKRPDRFSMEQIRSAAIIHESLAHILTTAFFKRFNTSVHFHIASIDQLTYEEFIRSIPTPTALAEFTMSPLPGKALLEIDPDIAFALLTLSLNKPDESKEQHELTEPELKTIADIIQTEMLPALQSSWKKILEINPVIERMETNPQFCQISRPWEMVLLVTAECKIGDVERLINLCYPYPVITPEIWRLTGDYLFRDTLCIKELPPEEKQNLCRVLEDSEIPVIVELGRTEKTFGELKSIEEGTIIVLNKFAGDTADVYAGNHLIARAEIVVINENFNIRITEINGNKINNFPKINQEYNRQGDLDKTGCSDVLEKIKIPVCVEIGRITRKISCLKELQSGMIIDLEKPAGGPLDVIAVGIQIAKGEVVMTDDYFGIRITELAWKKTPETSAT